jgi:hypothetical protein
LNGRRADVRLCGAVYERVRLASGLASGLASAATLTEQVGDSLSPHDNTLTLTVRSNEVERNLEFFERREYPGKMSQSRTDFVWPLNVFRQSPEVRSHSFSVVSKEQERMCCMSPEIRTAFTAAVWPA